MVRGLNSVDHMFERTMTTYDLVRMHTSEQISLKAKSSRRA